MMKINLNISVIICLLITCGNLLSWALPSNLELNYAANHQQMIIGGPVYVNVCIDGDTVVDGKNYQKVWYYSAHAIDCPRYNIALIREEGKKTYMRLAAPKNEISSTLMKINDQPDAASSIYFYGSNEYETLIYDLDMQPGDTLQLVPKDSEDYHFLYYYSRVVVKSVDYILYLGEKRIKQVTDNYTVIEGIGAINNGTFAFPGAYPCITGVAPKTFMTYIYEKDSNLPVAELQPWAAPRTVPLSTKELTHEYTPLIDSTLQWNYIYRPDERIRYTLKFEGTQEINGKNYGCLYCYQKENNKSRTLIAYLREEAGKVYMLTSGNTIPYIQPYGNTDTETLIYDFCVAPGESWYIGYPFDKSCYSSLEFNGYVMSVADDYELLQENRYHVIHTNSFLMAEGLGVLDVGLLCFPGAINSDLPTRLINNSFFGERDNSSYYLEEVSRTDGTILYSIYGGGGIEDNITTTSSLRYSNGSLHVNAEGNWQLSFITSTGQRIKTISGTGNESIDLSWLPQGIYIVQASDGSILKLAL